MKRKHLLTIALLAVFMGARAEWVDIYKIDYSSYSAFPFYVMGYVPEWSSGVMTDYGANYKYVTLDNADGETSDVIVTTQDGTRYYKIEAPSPVWHQYFIADGIPTMPNGKYKVKAMVKASEPVTFNVNMGWGWEDGEQLGTSVSIGTQWKEVEWAYSGVGGSSCYLVAQPGTTTATIEWKYVTVSEFIELDGVTPNPTLVVVNAPERDFTNDEKAGGTGYPWDSQFWIMSNRTLDTGEVTFVSFKYKAAHDARTTTQCHSTPGNYLHWEAIGDVNFTDEWQTFKAIFTVPAEANGMQSIAFNLSEIKEANIYEIKDVIWTVKDNHETLIDMTGSNNFWRIAHFAGYF